MTVLNKIATAFKMRGGIANRALAEEIIITKDKSAVAELIEGLHHQNRNIQSDCIKVLIQVGQREPALIAQYLPVFGKLLGGNNSRLVWGAMIALHSIAEQEPRGVYSLLPRIMAAVDAGSVVARDHAVGILVKLAALKQYSAKCFPLIVEQVMSCPNNQFPTYAEKALAVVTDKNRERLREVVAARLDGVEQESKRRRVEKVLKRLA
jgi:hypothetical protein